MRLFACPKERAIWRSIATGHWELGLREHVASCARCHEVALVSRGLQQLSTPQPPSLPDPHQILWRARWLQSQADGERAIRPITLYQRFAVVAAAVLGLLIWPWLLQWTPTWPGQWIVFGLTVPVLAVASSGLTLAAIAVLFALRASLSEE